MQANSVAVMYPLVVGISASACTIVVHALALNVIIYFIRRERRIGRAGARFSFDLTMVIVTVVITLAAHLIDVVLWAGLFLIVGEFRDFGIAFYHSAMNYTTLGYGDIVMSHAWKLLGPLEAADGMLMFGVSTAVIFAVIQRLIQTRFPDLRD
jgi:Ion channel